MVSTLERPTGRVPIVGKAAIYTRISTSRQEDGASLHVQLESCRQYCESHGLLVTGKFKDIQSGLDPGRAEYVKALELARAKGIDKLVVWRLDRLGRDSAEYIPLLKELRRIGISVVSVTQPTESVFMQQVIGIMAEEESRQLSTRVTASKLHLAKEGKWTSGAPFGYTLQRLPEGGCIPVPHPQEAPLVTDLFKRYAAGKVSLNDMRAYLKENGYPKSRAAVAYILKNPAYLGIVQSGKFARSPFMSKGETLRYQGKHEPLIDRATFDKAQERLEDNRNRKKGGPAPHYLFSGLIYCGGCGHKYAGRTAPVRGWKNIQYTCGRRQSFGDCPSHTVTDTRIRSTVIPPIKTLIERLKAEDVRTAAREELTRRQSATKSQATASKENLTDRQVKLEARLSRLEDSYLDGDIGKDRYLTRRDEILTQLAEIKEALAIQPKAVNVDLDQLFAIADAITVETLDDQAWRDIIEGMVDRVIIEGTGDGRKSPPTIKVVWKPAYEPLFTLATES
jgi:site-specific DNA recombinase